MTEFEMELNVAMQCACRWGQLIIPAGTTIEITGTVINNGCVIEPGVAFSHDRGDEDRALTVTGCTFIDTSPLDVADCLIPIIEAAR